METPARDTAWHLRAAEDLAPRIRQLRQEIERERTLPAELVAAMTDAG